MCQVHDVEQPQVALATFDSIVYQSCLAVEWVIAAVIAVGLYFVWPTRTGTG